MESDNIIKDPDAESAEFCLDCYRKHTGKGLVNIKEVIERFRQNPNYDDPKNLEFIWIHADKAMNEFAEAEEHVNKVNKDSVDDKTHGYLSELGHDARTIRDHIRKYVKTIPNKNSDNYNEMINKVLSKELIPRIDHLWEAKTQSETLRPKIHKLTAEIGCGDCLASKEDLDKVDLALYNILQKETNLENPLGIDKIYKEKNEDVNILEKKKDTVAASKMLIPKIDIPNMLIPENILISKLKELNLPEIDNIFNDLASGFNTDIVNTQIEHVKKEVKTIPVLFVNDFIVALFGSPFKK